MSKLVVRYCPVVVLLNDRKLFNFYIRASISLRNRGLSKQLRALNSPPKKKSLDGSFFPLSDRLLLIQALHCIIFRHVRVGHRGMIAACAPGGVAVRNLSEGIAVSY